MARTVVPVGIPWACSASVQHGPCGHINLTGGQPTRFPDKTDPDFHGVVMIVCTRCRSPRRKHDETRGRTTHSSTKPPDPVESPIGIRQLPRLGWPVPSENSDD